jgi:hypothetical protein
LVTTDSLYNSILTAIQNGDWDTYNISVAAMLDFLWDSYNPDDKKDSFCISTVMAMVGVLSKLLSSSMLTANV